MLSKFLGFLWAAARRLSGRAKLASKVRIRPQTEKRLAALAVEGALHRASSASRYNIHLPTSFFSKPWDSLEGTHAN
jgi:hypothetical protein